MSREAKEIAPEREAPELKACIEVEERVVVEESVVVAESAAPFRFAAMDISEHILAVVDLPQSGNFNQFGNLHQRLFGQMIRALNLPSDHSWSRSKHLRAMALP